VKDGDLVRLVRQQHQYTNQVRITDGSCGLVLHVEKTSTHLGGCWVADVVWPDYGETYRYLVDALEVINEAG